MAAGLHSHDAHRFESARSAAAKLLSYALPFVAAGVFTLMASARKTAAQPSMVILVRHGEKEVSPESDVSLSKEGFARAEALNEALLHLTPDAIVVTTYKRTQQTAAVVAKRAGITPIVVPVTQGHVRAVADTVMRQSGVVLVVGHNNTVPAVIGALGGPGLATLCETNFATLFILLPARDGKSAQLVKSSYGAPDAPGATECRADTR